MPRSPEPELQRPRQGVSVQRLVEASGVESKKAGEDWLGRCPFHDDARRCWGSARARTCGAASAARSAVGRSTG